MKTIAQQLNIKEFPFTIKDKMDNLIYYEDPIGYWMKREYNKNGNQTYYENSDGYWTKTEWDEEGNQIYYENSHGEIKDRRPKPEYTMEQLVEKLGEDFKLVK
jgi:hypothetical protein